jgi:hypothetical protein
LAFAEGSALHGDETNSAETRKTLRELREERPEFLIIEQ